MNRDRAWALTAIDIEPRPAILRQAYVIAGMRCLCPTCFRLDARYPNDGYQLALFPYRRDVAR